MSSVVIIGQGYVGLPLAMAASDAGFLVWGLDSSQRVVEGLNRGRSHIDDVDDAQLAHSLRCGYRATTDPSVISQADVAVVCVPTPLSSDGGPDLTAVRGAALNIADHVRPGTLVILESTTYPGTTEEIFAPIVLGENLNVQDVMIAFSPERVDPGNKLFSIANTPKIVGGLTPEAAEAAEAFYSAFVTKVVTAKGAKEAELAKLLENTFRHVNIALVNEMLRFSNDLDVDLWNAIECAETKPFGFMAFRPGPGVGGHCIPVDPSYLSHRVKAELGYSFRMVELAEEVNASAPFYVAARVGDALNGRRKSVNGSKVLLLGVTYKANIADRRKSPADPLAAKLIELGASVTFHDPYIHEWTIEGRGGTQSLNRAPDPYAGAADADVVVLLQAHEQYDLTRIADAADLLLDTRAAVPVSPSVVRL